MYYVYGRLGNSQYSIGISINAYSNSIDFRIYLQPTTYLIEYSKIIDNG